MEGGDHGYSSYAGDVKLDHETNANILPLGRRRHYEARDILLLQKCPSVPGSGSPRILKICGVHRGTVMNSWRNNQRSF
jgi:hypothetical protein